MKKILMAALIGLLVSESARADLFHYNNLLVGERAMGLGGAFTAVADDASGLIYNPAGMAFAVSNDVSGSANAYYQRKVRYIETIGDEDFFERSDGSAAPFFGALQKLDDIVPGLALGFGIYTTDSELKNQNDLVEAPSRGLRRFHRTANVRASTTGVTVGGAYRVTSSFSLGLSLHALFIDELVQEYQHVSYTDGRFLTQNIRSHLTSTGFETGIGAQYAIGNFSFGVNVRLRSVIAENFDDGFDLTLNFDDRFQATGEFLPAPLQVFRNTQNKDPLQVLPHQVRFGMAWFASARLLLTADASFNTEAKEGEARFDRETVTNFATGAEYYITPSVPIRVGLFTNNDAREELVPTKSGQRDHIDYTGVSLFFVWVQPNSQISLGTIYQTGSGEAQKTTGSAIQDVEADSITGVFSATHSY